MSSSSVISMQNNPQIWIIPDLDVYYEDFWYNGLTTREIKCGFKPIFADYSPQTL